MPQAENKNWVLRAKSQGYLGNDLVFWRKGGGYSSALDQAERFTREEAIAANEDRDTDLPMRYSELEQFACMTVDMQKLPTYEEDYSKQQLTDPHTEN